jgi:hypothetical protein
VTVIRLLHKLLTHPMTIIVGVVLGFVVGFRFPEFSARLKPVAEMRSVESPCDDERSSLPSQSCTSATPGPSAKQLRLSICQCRPFVDSGSTTG